MTSTESLKRRVLQEVQRRPSPVRSERWWSGPALGVAPAAAMLGLLALWGGLAPASSRPFAAGLAMIGGTLALAMIATWLALPARRSMLSRPAPVLLGVALGVPALLGAWLLAGHPAYDDPYVRNGLRCFVLTVTTAPWPFLALALAARRFEPRLPGLAGAALGSAAGAWAGVVAEAWCPLAAPDHVALGHVLPLLVLAGAGALVGRWLFRVRAG